MEYVTPNCIQCKSFLDRYNYIEVNSSDRPTIGLCSVKCLRDYTQGQTGASHIEVTVFITSQSWEELTDKVKSTINNI